MHNPAPLAYVLHNGEAAPSAQHVWTAVLPKASNGSNAAMQHAELVITLPEHLADAPATLKVWNVVSGADSDVVPVKWMAVLQGDSRRWHGIVNPASNANGTLSATTISLAHSVKQVGTRQRFSRVPSAHTTSDGAEGSDAARSGSDKSAQGSQTAQQGYHSAVCGSGETLLVATPLLTQASDKELLAEVRRRGFTVAGSATESGAQMAGTAPQQTESPAAEGAPAQSSPVRRASAAQSRAAPLPEEADSPAEIGAAQQGRSPMRHVRAANPAAQPLVQRDSAPSDAHGVSSDPPLHFDQSPAMAPVSPQQHVSAAAPAVSALPTAATTAGAQCEQTFAKSSSPVHQAAESFEAPECSDSPSAARANVLLATPQGTPADEDAFAVDLVLSADSNVAHMPGIGLTLDQEHSRTLSEQLNASHRASTASSSGSLLEGQDLSLASAMQRKNDVNIAVPLRTVSDPKVNTAAQHRPAAFATEPADVGPAAQRAATALPSEQSPASKPLGRPGAATGVTTQGPAAANASTQQAMLRAFRRSANGGDSDDGDALGEYAPRARAPDGPVAARRRVSGTHGASPTEPKPSSLHNIENRLGVPPAAAAPVAGRRGPPIDLNQSLDSLTFFQRHNRGRLADSGGLSGSIKPAQKRDVWAPPPPPTLPAPQEHRALLRDPSLHVPMATVDTTSPLFRQPSVEQRGAGAAQAAQQTAAQNSGGTEAVQQQPVAPAFLRELADGSSALSEVDAEVSGATAASSDAPWPDADFCIPVEPAGRHLQLQIFSTWGDVHYVGLSAIEVFNAKGELVTLQDRSSQVTADPHSVNVLPESADDPRVPENLFDGVNCTCSDLHQWLTPFTPGAVHTVSIDLGAEMTLGMLRMWNYNKSRIHAQRGVRAVEIALDGNAIFQGEISQAPGAVSDAPASAECIVFTQSDDVLNAIEKHDAVYEQPAEAQPDGDATPSEAAPAIELVRDAGSHSSPPAATPLDRPRTSAAPPAARGAPSGSAVRGVSVRVLTLEVLATWGDESYVGLTGLRVLDAHGGVLPLTIADVDACPRDLNDIPGVSGQDRTLDKLVDGRDNTTDDRHMWLAPCSSDPNLPLCTMTLTLGAQPVQITGLQLWNYNKDAEGTLRGVGVVRVLADGQLVTPPWGVAIAKAPASAECDFSSILTLPARDATPAAEAEPFGGAMALLAATVEPRLSAQVLR